MTISGYYLATFDIYSDFYTCYNLFDKGIMANVTYGSAMPSSFLENLSYDTKNPFRINVKRFPSDEVTILHYADSVEILVADGLKGKAIISSKMYEFGEKQVFVIPQNVVHRTMIEKCDGVLYVLKIHLRSLEELINLNVLFGEKRIDSVKYTFDAFDEMKDCIERLLGGADIFGQMQVLLDVLGILYKNVRDEGVLPEHSHANSILRKVLDWTAEHCGGHVLIQEVADHIGYSKFHFVKWFKKLTGITYGTYLSHVRIEKAKQYLIGDMDVSKVAKNCGYENVSHFIAMFRKYEGCTPKEYVRSLGSRPSGLTTEY